MRALILGAGTAGRQLARLLCESGHDVVLMDLNRDALEDAEERLDILTLQGDASSPRDLYEARINRVDLLVAVTNRDEVNILACVYAKAAGAEATVARVTNPDYLETHGELDLKALGVDLVVNQQDVCARELANVLTLPGTFEVLDLLDGRAQVVGVKVGMDNLLIRTTLREIPERELLDRIRFIAILRGPDPLVPSGNTQIRIGDELYFAGTPEDNRAFLKWATPDLTQFPKVVIGGGGELGLSLALKLEEARLKTVVVESDPHRAEHCSTALTSAMVIEGDALDPETLQEAGVEGAAFVASTGSDEANIMNCLLAEKQGAVFTAAQITKSSYLSLIDTLSLLDRTASPYRAMTNAVLQFVRGRSVRLATLMHHLPGELLETVLSPSSPLNGKRIRDGAHPKDTIIVTVEREGRILTPTGDLQLRAGDRTVWFASGKGAHKVARLT